jgi:hypothetical protein
MGNDEHRHMQLKFQYAQNPSVFVTIPKVGWTALNPTAANYTVLTEKSWVLSEQWLAFAQAVWLGQNHVPQTWLMNMGCGADDTRASDLYQHSGVTQRRILHGLMS